MTQHRIIWEQNLQKGLSTLHCSVDMSMIWEDPASYVKKHSLGRGPELYKSKEMKLRTSNQGTTYMYSFIFALDCRCEVTRCLKFLPWLPYYKVKWTPFSLKWLFVRVFYHSNINENRIISKFKWNLIKYVVITQYN